MPSPDRLETPAARPMPGAVDVPTLWRWTLVLVALGSAWRLARYALAFPFWGDESFLNTSVLTRSFAGLLAPLEYFQVAPIGYLWLQKGVFVLFGGGEYALRAVALVAGVAALLLFVPFAWRTLPPRSAAIAVGIFAGSYYLVRHTCEAKQYATDLFASMLLLWLAGWWLERPTAAWRGLTIALVAAGMVWLSLPGAFVAAGIGLAVAISFWRRRAPVRSWLLWGVYGVVSAASFAGVYFLYIDRHAARTRDSWLEDYWRDAFPPQQWGEFLWWLLEIHAGRMLAYPFGGGEFTSSGTLLLVLVGMVALVRAGRGSIALLVLAPLVPTFAAAGLEKYPYGGSVRVSIFMAPAFCLLAGAGAGYLIDHVLARRYRDLVGALVGGVLVLIPVGGIVYDVLRPYKVAGDPEIRAALRDFAARVEPGDQIVIQNPPFGRYDPPGGPMFHQSARYYLELYTGITPTWYVEDGYPPDTDWVLVMHGPFGGPPDDYVRAKLNAAGFEAREYEAISLLPDSPAALRIYASEPLP